MIYNSQTREKPWQVINDSAKGRIWHGLFIVVLHRPFCAQKVHVLFAGGCLYLCLVVEVAVVAKDEL